MRIVFLIFSLSFLGLSELNATHIIGGEISFDFIEFKNNGETASYEFEMILYRDPTGVAYPNFVNFGIYQQDDSGRWVPFQVVKDVPRSPITEITRTPDPCRTRELTDDRVQYVTYTFQADLDLVGRDYLIAYQACCRNPTINNIVDAGIGAVYDVIMTSATIAQGNSSPQFKSFPPIFICAGYDFEFDHSALDIEGDELVYSFCTSNFPGYDDGSGGPTCCGCVTPDPQICTPPFLDVIYAFPFTAENPMGGSPQITIDPTTGIISGRPEFSGAYIVSVCVEEYQNGILLSKIRRDFEFNVVVCDENLIASLETSEFLSEVGEGYYYEICHETDLVFENSSTDTRFIQNYTWTFEDENGSAFTVSGLDKRNVTIEFPSPGIYTGVMTIDDGGTCEDSIDIVVNIIAPADIDVEFTFDDCIAGPIDLGYRSNVELNDFEWSMEMGDGNQFSELINSYLYNSNGSYLIDINATDEFGCVTEFDFEIEYFPYQAQAPDTIRLDTMICYEDSIFINTSWVDNSGTYLDFIASEFSGCDSIVKVIDLIVTDYIESETLARICEGDSYNFGSKILSVSGVYYDTLNASNLCDSISILELTVNRKDTTYLEAEICASEMYEFGELELEVEGTYDMTKENINGCDSLVILDLSVYDEDVIELTGEICDGGFYEVAGREIFEGGDYEFNLENIDGCDSTIFLALEKIDNSGYAYIDTICFGETYPFGALDLTVPGIYYDTLFNSNGCDSVVILDLVVGQNLSRINADDEVELDYGTVIYLEPVILGGDLLITDWYVVDRHLSEGLTVSYLIERDDWLYFESTNALYCVAIDSIFIRSKVIKEVYIPNVFTPDGDNFNDFFNILGTETIVDSQLNIFDRWGNHIYKGDVTTDRNSESGWDGTFNGNRVEDGTYVYMVEVNFVDGTSKIFSGSVNMIR